MKRLFKIGDKVKVITWGSGVSDKHINKIVKVVELGMYGRGFGVRVKPPIGNSKNGGYGYMIGENTFELAIPKKIKEWRGLI